jgi:hypothetical protein
MDEMPGESLGDADLEALGRGKAQFVMVILGIRMAVFSTR